MILRDPAFSRLFADCPVYLWPVLAWSLWGLVGELARLKAADDTWFELRLTRWGKAYIVKAPTRPLPTWKDELFRTVMGEPVEAPEPNLPKLGIVTAEAQTGWAWHEFGPARQGAAWISLYDRMSSVFWLGQILAAVAGSVGARAVRCRSCAPATGGISPLCNIGVRAPP